MNDAAKDEEFYGGGDATQGGGERENEHASLIDSFFAMDIGQTAHDDEQDGLGEHIGKDDPLNDLKICVQLGD